MQIPKPKRHKDKKYLEWILTQPCIVDNCECLGDIIYHHTVTVGAGGSDKEAVPLCKRHHIPGVHSMGKKTFQEKYGINFKLEILRLIGKYENMNKRAGIKY